MYWTASETASGYIHTCVHQKSHFSKQFCIFQHVEIRGRCTTLRNDMILFRDIHRDVVKESRLWLGQWWLKLCLLFRSNILYYRVMYYRGVIHTKSGRASLFLKLFLPCLIDALFQMHFHICKNSSFNEFVKLNEWMCFQRITNHKEPLRSGRMLKN